jgi:hypothetical protein
MTATCELYQERTTRRTRVETILRVALDGRYLGDILLDGKGRVWRHADTIPADVVFKAMLGHNRRNELCGELVGLKDGRNYTWFVVGAFAEAA